LYSHWRLRGVLPKSENDAISMFTTDVEAFWKTVTEQQAA
jgi:hypothetical protein